MLDQRGLDGALQIFATGISESAIAKAREGLYSANIAADVSPERLRRFFVKTNGGYQISKTIRDICVFAVQNVVKDPLFSRMDLISCRNVLIYLGTALQERALNTMHYALKSSGILFLGVSETVAAAANLYHEEDKKRRFYSRRHTTSRLSFDFAGSPRLNATVAAQRGAETQREIDVEKEASSIVLNQFAPPGVVVNESMDAVLFRGQTNPFLEPAPGKPTFNILKMAHPELLLDLRSVIQQARQTATPVRRQELKLGTGIRTIDLIALPLFSRKNHCLVLFEDVTPPKTPPVQAENTGGLVAGQPKKREAAAERYHAAITRELAETNRDLHAIIQEQEATNEELQAANEEILSSNAELQSTNEELQTAKEELQATNEELTTVNEEMQNRNAELTHAIDDLRNLTASIDVGIVMLESDLTIRHFTPAAAKVLNLIAGDIGRPIGNIKPNLNVGDLDESGYPLYSSW